MFPRLSVRILLPGFAVFLGACEEPRLSSNGEAFDPTGVSDATALHALLSGLGADLSTLPPDFTAEEKADDGRSLVFQGRIPDTEGKKLSAYFYCADCHGTAREQSTADTYEDPVAKLAYTIENDLPHLPAPSFAGVVNREGFFQGEIGKRFGASGDIAKDLEGAIQFCSTTLARGRELDEPEMEALLSYLWSLEWRVGDLGFRGADLAELKRRALNPDEHSWIINDLQENYLLSTNSTAGRPPDDPREGFKVQQVPDLETGEAIWSRSCLHCHGAGGASEHYFGERASTWELIGKGFREGWLYEHLRIGTFSKDETTAHMPPFSKERLNDAQIESLRTFIESKLPASTKD